MTCTGDQSGGISEANPPIGTLNVNSLTTANAGSVSLTGHGGNGSNGLDFPVHGLNGGGGGPGQLVSVNYVGGAFSISTSNQDQIGIRAVSNGGNGGRGGDGLSGLGLPGWGGHGGDGGAGGTVQVNAEGSVTTSGSFAHGIFGESNGGDGGNGGNSTLLLGSYGEGGDGGNGKEGGSVTVTNNASIATVGAGAQGIFASTTGGIGGDGGSVRGLGIVGVGGRGAEAANGGTLSVANSGQISTGGSGAVGVLAQSIGGFGGSGGGSGAGFAFGGSPNSAGDGGSVTVTNRGVIETEQVDARGVLAQSIGGGGGSGGSAAGIVALGGEGEAAGDGSSVTVKNFGSVSTGGNNAQALLAQSVGGGGGNSGAAGGVVSVGGSGDSGGDGGSVDVTNDGVLTTKGAYAHAILAQSIGGGGGDGGFAAGLVAVGGTGAAAGDGDSVKVNNSGSVSTTGDKAKGLLAQSVGGGGGNGGSSGGMVSVGGGGGSGGDSKKVTVINGGDISTKGNDASGIFAQSVGGGGGDGGSAGSVSAFVGVAVGGAGDSGGEAGDVIVTLQGKDASTPSAIRTEGDRSNGVFAQSVGGGGGNGGGAVQATAGLFGAVSVAIGGNGGGGGGGGKVTVSPGTGGTSVIETGGDDSTGVFLQSVGGGGGNGGYAVSLAASVGLVSGSLSVGVGGDAGTAGEGGEVEVGELDADGNLINTGFNGSILTMGERSTGFFAQSVGGGGGNGGLAVSAAASGSKFFSASVGVGVGGKGGAGGAGGTVSAATEGNITTQGAHSTGMLVQSVGGGGGNGGGTVTTALSAAAGVGASVSVGVGGDGGAGSEGGTVTAATRSGTVTTSGESSSGIVVQSVGGGGGNGGYSVTAGIAGAGAGAGSVNVGLGGKGSTGGHGGTVKADLQSDVNTSGDNSGALLVQSVGGGGGNGGFTVTAGGAGAGKGAGTVSVGLGGGGGAAGNGGAVVASSSGTITTQGNSASGFVAQSIGGGGGSGGFNVSGTIAAAGAVAGSVSVGLGGTGGEGGVADTVTATSSGDVLTQGSSSAGILAQSVGGGGGNGGFNVSVALSGAGKASASVGVGLGGSGGDGAHGSTVDLSVDNDVTTTSRDSVGVIAQSVGGGGGNGGFNVSVAGSASGKASGAGAVGLGGSAAGGGDAKRVTSTMTGNISTKGENSTGLLVQSVGGGGGNGGFNVSAAISASGTAAVGASVGLGGSGGTGGTSGPVTSTLTGDVVTSGKQATGVIAQSLGGGGGNGGINISGTVALASKGSGAASVGLGGAGGDGGDALGLVTNSVTGDVTTLGDGSGGVLAQGVGGGGGNGGLNISGAITASGTAAGSVAVGIGGSGGDGGKGSEVDNRVIGDVTTSGNESFGVLAQSIGGGGGNGGTNIGGAVTVTKSAGAAVGVGVGGSGGLGKDSDKVTNRVTGDVRTSGNDAFGIMAQSVGGGGGNGGVNINGALSIAKSAAGAVAVGFGGSGGEGGLGKDVINTLNGTVVTKGDRSAGIITQSLGGGGGNGGVNVSGTLSAAKSTSGSLAVGVGGFGGMGKSGADATSTVTGDVITMGEDSPGILTQSLGGGGGNGGVNVTVAVNLTKEKGGALGVGVGGFGAGGGHAGNVTSTVTVTEGNLIGTAGDGSSAVIAQSIGGGGGNGGVNVTGVLSATGKSGAAIGVGVGGFGGGAGNGGNVTLTTTGDVVTEGNDSHGLFAQSLGGGGGNGGVNVSASLNINKEGKGGSASIGVGGFGGGGGNAGSVDVTYQGTIVAVPKDAEGPGSHGLVAQSLGGGGGNGAVNVSAGLAFSSRGEDGDGHALVVGVGGFGGGGGNAGAVGVTVGEDSEITSFGDDRSALLAQSIGGGGGNGGLNVSAGIAADAPIVFGMGGFAGGGGKAASVTVDAIANLLATGKSARGIFAQSVGGGGGDGGLNVSGAISYSKGTTPPALVFGMGGFGGAGNVSSDVDVTHEGTIVTSGADGHGIFAQSIAGGGGNGGLNVSAALIGSDKDDSGGFKDLSITAGLGGHGGTGADAGNTIVSSVGTIKTEGDYARGIFAQSIGGGGGNGGMNFTGNVAQKSSLVTLGVGGFGLGGGKAGSVTVLRGNLETAAGKITTNGTGAIGIEASSIGGGGGDAGLNLVASVSFAGEDNGNGGDGGDGGDGGNKRPHPKHTGVDPEVFENYDKVLDELEGRQKKDKEDEKQKDDESGFAVQVAIGGSGGGAGDGGAASVDNHGDVETHGKQSHGILAQSIGGGGGNAAMNIALTYFRGDAVNRGLNFALGGATGDGGSAGTVQVDHDGMVETHGADSYGIVAQSVGGGGGNASAFLNKSKGDVSKLDISIGRRGGSGGEGGNVTLNSAGSVLTHGDRSWGLIAQSIGNGGGNSSATTISGTIEGEKGKAARGASLSIGLEGGVGGSAGNVTLNAEGVVGTMGTSAHAMFAQSVGGGGGNGGDTGASSANASISLGGSGGKGGAGGQVDVTTSAEVRTLGARAYGLIAQSIGGGGGTGGKSEAEVESSEPGLAISLGGSGGEGSVGGAVTVNNSGLIITGGDEAIGVLAQSVGGGGGNGGMSVTSLKTKEEEDEDGENGGGNGGNGNNGGSSAAVQLAVNVGGAGGTGATAGKVEVTNAGVVRTEGTAAPGIFAQSIGGGGGNASQVVSKFSGPGAKFSIGIGGAVGTDGKGAMGGTGGDVTVENLADTEGNTAQIVTLGKEAHGIVAMSIGGGGGNGSAVVSENENENESLGDFTSEPKTLGVSLNIGGSGGQGGTSGLVRVINAGEIRTLGEGAHGIFAQSIGGGGGNGGVTYTKDTGLKGINSSVDSAISIGGGGGSGNVSGDIVVTNTGSIEVFGDGAYGVFAQSIGGGGGNGGLSGAAPPESSGGGAGPVEPQPQTPSLLGFTLGGKGGEGADSGKVTVDHRGSIVSHGDNSYGIFAESIAGGGGTAGATYSTLGGKAAEFAIPLLLGVRDGSSGQAGVVEVNTQGDILMLGANSKAYHAESVNGGGGNVRLTLDASNTTLGQVNPGPGKPKDPVSAFIVATIEVGSEAVENGIGAAIKSEHLGDLVTLGKGSTASNTQSIGGGGGNADVDIATNPDAKVELSAALGGRRSKNSSGGNITQKRTGNVSTSGDQSRGGFVQSVGGGGGNVALNIREVPLAGQRTSNAADPKAKAKISLGSAANSGNNGGDIALFYRGDVSTSGDHASGLVVQSIGAGGGQTTYTGGDTLEVFIGAKENSEGNGGSIFLKNTGGITTFGELSHGIVVQSIGGGGGFVSTDLNENAIAVTPNALNRGDGGAIRIDQTGDILVSGDRSIGVLAQSLGGGGGLVDRKFMNSAGGAGRSGAIDIDLKGNVVATGRQGVGVFAQSRGADGQDDVSASLADNKVLFFGPNGVGFWVSGGASNRIVNKGTVAGFDDLHGLGIRGEEGGERVDNFGTIVGNVDLGGGANSFYNHQSATLYSGAFLGIGVGNPFTNAGHFSPGRSNRVQTTTLVGNVEQVAAGTYAADLDLKGDHIDRVNVTGTAKVSGRVTINPMNTGWVAPGYRPIVMVSTTAGASTPGARLVAPPSAVADYDIVILGGKDIALGLDVDFSPIGLNRNQTAIGDHFNQIQLFGGSESLASIAASIFVLPGVTDVARAYDRISPEPYAAEQTATVLSSQEFTDSLFSCRVRDGAYRFTAEGECSWVRASYSRLDSDSTFQHFGFDDRSWNFSAGLQRKLNADWFIGGALSLVKDRIETEDLANSEGETGMLGVTLKRFFGATKLGFALSGGIGGYDTDRYVNFPKPVVVADSSQTTRFFSAQVRLSHDFERGDWYFRPLVDFGGIYFERGDFNESGAGALSLRVDKSDETYGVIHPAFELGGEIARSSGLLVRPRLKLGLVHFFSGDKPEVSATLLGAPAGVHPFTVRGNMDKTYATVDAGVDLLDLDGKELRLSYIGQFSDHTRSHGGSLRLSIPF